MPLHFKVVRCLKDTLTRVVIFYVVHTAVRKSVLVTTTRARNCVLWNKQGCFESELSILVPFGSSLGPVIATFPVLACKRHKLQ